MIIDAGWCCVAGAALALLAALVGIWYWVRASRLRGGWREGMGPILALANLGVISLAFLVFNREHQVSWFELWCNVVKVHLGLQLATTGAGAYWRRRQIDAAILRKMQDE